MDELELIKEKLNVVDLISEYLPLKKTGVNFKANCPFHQEKTPSFVVSPERGIWHCFGCQKGGDIFKFVMEKEGLEFKDALELLAQKAGVPLKKRKTEVNATDKLFEANQKAQQFYHYLLTEHPLGKKALGYLKNRGLTDETIKEFQLGYAPNNWEVLTKFLKKRGFKVDEIVNSGLAIASNSGCYDRFRGRIIFPLIDPRDRVIGFSGRILDIGEPARNVSSLTDAGGPKYVNTPQTPIFNKSNLLFGLNKSKTDIKQKKEAILVEGEMDMLMSYQSGIKNIVATKGTALTDSHIEILKKYCQSLSLCFDMDLAGDFAARRGIEMADKAGFNIKVIELEEDAKDPAETCLTDPKSWFKSVKNALPIYDYYLNSISKRYDLKLASSKKSILEELLPIWSKISSSIVQEHYIQKLAAFLQVKEDLISKEIIKFTKLSQNPTPTITSQKPTSATAQKLTTPIPLHPDRRRLLEEYLLSLIMHIPEDQVFIPSFPETLFTSDELKQLYVLLVLFLDTISFKGKSFKINDFISSLPDELYPTVDRLFLLDIDQKLTDSKNWKKEIDSVVLELKKMLIKTSLEKLSLQIKSAQEFDRVDTLEVLNKRFRDLSIKLKNL